MVNKMNPTLSAKRKYFRRFYRLFLYVFYRFIDSGFFWFLLGICFSLLFVSYILTTAFNTPFFNNLEGMCHVLSDTVKK